MSQELSDRIAYWEQVTRQTPSDLAWFSLGQACREAGRLEEAQQAFAQALALNPDLTRAYQLRAEALIQLGRTDQATEVLEQGCRVAARNGDAVLHQAMTQLLENLGRRTPSPPSQPPPPPATVPSSSDQIRDRKTGQPGTRLPRPPMRGPLGQIIYEHYSLETWRQWLMIGTRLINELRLDFSNPQHQELYDRYMMEYLGITDEELEAYRRKMQPSDTASP